MSGIDILINPASQDIDLTNFTISLVKDIETLVRQKVAITLRAFRGEWVYNVLFGIPYISNTNNNTQLLRAGTGTQRLLDFEIRSAILSKEEILRIDSFQSNINPQTRVYTVSFIAVTEGGPIVFDGEELIV